MKYLQDYQEEKQTKAFRKARAFFAFSNKQLEEGLDGMKKSDYVSLGAGLFCLKEKSDWLIEELDTIYKEAIMQDMTENGKEGVIKRELYNHEIVYTHDIQETVDALDGYPITRDEIHNVYLELLNNNKLNDE